MFAQPPLWFIAIAFLCAIGPLVFIHEMGHYLVARWFGIGADTFSIGFGREVAGWTDKRGTRWKIGWLPLGGYVKFVGDMNAASQAGADADLAPEQRAKAFHNKPWWQRFLVVLAGPVANFLLAIAIFAAFFAVLGRPSTPPVVAALQPGSAAVSAGLQVGDRLMSIAGQSTDRFEDIQRIVSIRPDERVVIAVERQGSVREIPATIGAFEMTDEFGQKFRLGQLGVARPKREFERVSPVAAIPAAAGYTVALTRSMVDGLAQIITGRRSTKDLGGPLKMAQIAGQQLSLGAFEFIQLVALFSINLGFINLLPVPMLDGGHLVFYAAEAVRRRPLSARAQDWAFRGGLAFLLALIVFTTANDLASFGLFEGLGRLIG
ncbi:RIP metalloprotease RseP [Sphingomonas sp. LY29]|uniref:RIP metalloprotease RseP n=1 Tax=Sphingomonas sp. LY29 TaxID=3095341 RepID=UPI002D78F9E5|nr:RIP metalloprotease RseP [Sphingomonas sp. LY29]WRP26149.1 RIP metalloprotease RseP [Sphingomonas sp. LY29]